MQSQKVTIGDWTVRLFVDDDGHLGLFTTHKSESEVSEVDSMLSDDKVEHSIRLTCCKIEDDYKEETAV